tara:strand:+ start:127 stop:345 length:219 start_codon:yes stop_codon:yes gene_type:complete
MFRILFSFLLFSLLFTSRALAYFDPGTGSYIIQLIIAFLASCYFFLTNPIKFIKEYLKKFKRKKEIDKKDQE